MIFSCDSCTYLDTSSFLLYTHSMYVLPFHSESKEEKLDYSMTSMDLEQCFKEEWMLMATSTMVRRNNNSLCNHLFIALIRLFLQIYSLVLLNLSRLPS